MKKIISTFSERLRIALDNDPEYNATSLAEKIGLSKQAISMYLSNARKPKRPTVKVISEVLNVNEAWLTGYDVPMERTNYYGDSSAISNLTPLTKDDFKKVPLLGNIACGTPILATENIEEYINMEVGINADFALRCKGDSMINARIFDGDIVYIRKQPRVENGEIAAVLIDDLECEATLKRVYIDNEKIRLCAENPLYKDLVFWGEEMDAVRIIGKAVAFLSGVK